VKKLETIYLLGIKLKMPNSSDLPGRERPDMELKARFWAEKLVPVIFHLNQLGNAKTKKLWRQWSKKSSKNARVQLDMSLQARFWTRKFVLVIQLSKRENQQEAMNLNGNSIKNAKFI
jgi:hypothetical protein